MAYEVCFRLSYRQGVLFCVGLTHNTVVRDETGVVGRIKK